MSSAYDFRYIRTDNTVKSSIWYYREETRQEITAATGLKLPEPEHIVDLQAAEAERARQAAAAAAKARAGRTKQGQSRRVAGSRRSSAAVRRAAHHAQAM